MALIRRTRPTPEALKRIRAAGEKGVLSFLDEVPSSAARALQDILPPMDGFRNSSAAGLAQRKKKLATILVGKSGSATERTKAERVLYAFWRAWGHERSGDAELFDRLLDAVDQASASEGSEETEQPSEQIEGLFQALHELSLANKVSRETLRRLFDFSPFDDTPSITALIASAKSEAEIQRDRELTELPKRLHSDEEALKSLQAQLRGATDRIDALATEIERLGRRSTETSSVLQAAPLSEFENLRKEVREVARGLSREMEQFRVRLASTEEHVVRRLDGAETMLLVLQEEVASDREQTSARIAEAERQWSEAVSALSGAVGPSASSAQIPQRPKLYVERLAVAEGEPKPLPLHSDALTHLAANLQSIGLVPTAADRLAEEVCAAAIMGQAVSFKGAFGTEVARACAASLCGGGAFHAAVPIGIFDAAEVTALSALSATDGQAVRGIVLEGVNNSPFEIFQDYIANLLAGPSAALVFMSLHSGLSGLPDQPLYLQVGPLVDLDVLDWKLLPKQRGPFKSGELSREELARWGDAARKKAVEHSQALALLAEVLARPNPRIAGGLVAHILGINHLRHVAHPTAVQSGAYAWIMPLLGMFRERFSRLEEALGDGRLDGDIPDERIVKLLGALAGEAEGG